MLFVLPWWFSSKPRPLGAVGALIVAFAAAPPAGSVLGVVIAFDRNVALLILAGSVVFAALGSLYPVFRSTRLSPVDATQSVGA